MSSLETSKILLAIPLMDEWENLMHLLEDINNQSYRNFTAVFCVNQPETWWHQQDKRRICENNAETLGYLSDYEHFSLKVIDRSSPGRGWTGKEHGVGWARKVAMDECMRLSGPGDIIISLDADTRFGAAYLESVYHNLLQHPQAVALSVPYYHHLSGKMAEDKAILRYEIYMRYYNLNLWRIQCPFRFTALGSAIAFPVSSYKAIRGMTPNKSGEDFYFLQKLRKYGPLLFWNPEKVYPAARFSDRVFFGTGPAMIKGSLNDWSSYPLYDTAHFDDISLTYSLFPDLFDKRLPTPMDDFLSGIFREDDIWEPLRRNHPRKERFIRACYEKVDGLRILQYLKSRNNYGNSRDEIHLKEYFRKFVDENDQLPFVTSDFFSLEKASIQDMDEIRNLMVKMEEDLQKDHYNRFNI